MTKKSKLLLRISLGTIFFILITGGLYALLGLIQQGEFWKYDKGFTIEVNNSSEVSIDNLKITYGYAEDTEFREIGTIKQLKPGEYSILTGSSDDIQNIDKDISIYMHYNLKNGDKKEESLVYFSTHEPSKVVVVLDIKHVYESGNIGFEKKGFDGVWKFEE